MSYKEHVSILLDSKNRTSGTNSNPIFNLEHQILFKQNNKKQYFAILHNTIIPRTYYEIDSNNNVFRISEQGGGTLVITIDEGNYTVSELISELESQLDTNTTNTNNYTLSYDSKTNKITFSFTGTSTDVTIDSIANGSTLNPVLGVSVLGNDGTTQINAGVSTEFPHTAQLVNKQYINVFTDLSSNNYYTNTDKQNIGVRVPITVDRNEIQVFNNYEGHRTLLNHTSVISRVELQLRDPNNNILNLNSADWSTELIIYEYTKQ